MAISSLPSPYGIGTLGKEAYEFIDFVRDTNHKYWQVLPVGPTTYGDSPYQPYSAFAGNPYFVDLDTSLFVCRKAFSLLIYMSSFGFYA